MCSSALSQVAPSPLQRGARADAARGFTAVHRGHSAVDPDREGSGRNPAPAGHAFGCRRRVPSYRGALPVLAVAWLLGAALPAAPAAAQEGSTEAPDPTRLDVERLPPEAIAITRDMFASGLYVEAHLGSRGFAGAVGSLASAGLYTHVGLGYELAQWLMLGASAELSMHSLHALPPPSEGNFQLLDAMAEARLQWPITVRFALWLAGQGGISWMRGNLLAVHGYPDANSVSLAYGGTLGFDWHLLSRHHSLGILGGARLYPGLQRAIDGARSYGIHGSAYLKYVF